MLVGSWAFHPEPARRKRQSARSHATPRVPDCRDRLHYGDGQAPGRYVWDRVSSYQAAELFPGRIDLVLGGAQTRRLDG